MMFSPFRIAKEKVPPRGIRHYGFLANRTKAEKLTRCRALLDAPRPLLIDELGLCVPIDKFGADLLFQIISQCYECGAIIITTNRTFKHWPEIFNNDSTLTSALRDRLLHHAETVIEDKSYRPDRGLINMSHEPQQHRVALPPFHKAISTRRFHTKFTPPLTHVRQDQGRLGNHAARSLMRLSHRNADRPHSDALNRRRPISRHVLLPRAAGG
jgi:hypothetical protein